MTFSYIYSLMYEKLDGSVALFLAVSVNELMCIKMSCLVHRNEQTEIQTMISRNIHNQIISTCPVTFIFYVTKSRGASYSLSQSQFHTTTISFKSPYTYMYS